MKLRGVIREVNASAPLASNICLESAVTKRVFPFGKLPYGSTLCHQLPEAELVLPEASFRLPVSILRMREDVTYDPRYQMTLEESYELEEATRDQNNKRWQMKH